MVDLPRIGVRIAGNDGKEGTEYEDSFVLDFPGLLITEVVHRRAQLRSLMTLLWAWDEALETYSKIAANQAVQQKREEERLGV